MRADLVGSMPAPASPAIAGIAPGAKPWVNGPSSVRVRQEGRITVSITGLVIPPPQGTGVNPIAAVLIQPAANRTAYIASSQGDHDDD